MRFELGFLALVLVTAALFGRHSAEAPPPSLAGPTSAAAVQEASAAGWHIHGVRPGMNEAQVIALVGRPRNRTDEVPFPLSGQRVVSPLEVWNYFDFKVLFHDGRVMAVSGKALQRGAGLRVSVDAPEHLDRRLGRADLRFVIPLECAPIIVEYWMQSDGTVVGLQSRFTAGRLWLQSSLQSQAERVSFWETSAADGTWYPVPAGRVIDSRRGDLLPR